MTLLKSLSETHADCGCASGPVDVQWKVVGSGHTVPASPPAPELLPEPELVPAPELPPAPELLLEPELPLEPKLPPDPPLDPAPPLDPELAAAEPELPPDPAFPELLLDAVPLGDPDELRFTPPSLAIERPLSCVEVHAENVERIAERTRSERTCTWPPRGRNGCLP